MPHSTWGGGIESNTVDFDLQKFATVSNPYTSNLNGKITITATIDQSSQSYDATVVINVKQTTITDGSYNYTAVGFDSGYGFGSLASTTPGLLVHALYIRINTTDGKTELVFESNPETNISSAYFINNGAYCQISRSRFDYKFSNAKSSYIADITSYMLGGIQLSQYFLDNVNGTISMYLDLNNTLYPD
jgi:hypothetical protein